MMADVSDQSDAPRTEGKYLSPTDILNSTHEDIVAYAERVVGDAANPVDKAVKLYYAVRDDIWYDPYSPFYLPKHYVASNVLKRGRGYCVGKAALLCALGRTCGIPSRVGFATVRNHLATRQLTEFMGSDLFVYHGFTEFWLEGQWVKATPAFNSALCRLHKVRPLEFNGREDSVFHEYNNENRRFMEYVDDHGSYADIPVDTIVAAWKSAYGEDRVGKWIREIEASGGKTARKFEKEDVV